MLRDIWFTFWAHSDFTDSTVSPDEIRRSEVTESHIMRPLFMDSTSLPSTAVLEELEKILSGSVFRNAGRSSRLLRFVVDETLNGRADRLKDYTLGAEALGRGDDFDPRTDPIARVEASRLRSRLELYYATEGASDPVIITLPKGSYVPVFENRIARSDTASPKTFWRRDRLVWTLVALIALFAAVESLRVWRGPSNLVSGPEMRLDITTPPTTDPVSLAISPDGQKIVFVATSQGRTQLWLRPLDSASAHPLAGTDYASAPFWSPDSHSVAFFAEGKLRRIDLDSGFVEFVARSIVPAGGAWNQDGMILFPIVPDSPLFKVSAKGGEPARLTQLEPHQTGHRSPQFLPDGRHFLYYAMGSSEVRGIYVGDLRGDRSQRLLDADGPAVYASTGHLLFVRQGTLFAQNFDPVSLKLIAKLRSENGLGHLGSAANRKRQGLSGCPNEL